MDPNTLSSLDPKLRETYEKVMGAGAAPVAPEDPLPVAPAAQPAPVAQLPPAEEAVPTVAPAAPSPELTNMPVADPQLAADQPKVVTITQSMPNPAPELQVTPPTTHGHKGLIRIFYVLGTAVFFVIYIFFWMKIFNIQLPF